MLQSSKAYALLQGRDFVTPEDIKFVAPYVLQHRLILTAEAEMEGYSPVKVTQRLIDKERYRNEGRIERGDGRIEMGEGKVVIEYRLKALKGN